MDHARLVRALGLVLFAMLGIGALAATSASAEGEWRVNGAKLTKAESFTGLIATTTEYLFLFGAFPLVIHCEIKLWVGVVLLPSGESHGTHRYEACKSLVSGKEVAACKPGVIEFGFKSLLFLHNKKTYILFEPKTGSSFGKIPLGEECAVAEELFVGGTYVMECIEPASCEAEVLVHPMTFASSALFPSDQLKIGAQTMAVHGRDITEINGVNIGKAWSAVG